MQSSDSGLQIPDCKVSEVLNFEFGIGLSCACNLFGIICDLGAFENGDNIGTDPIRLICSPILTAYTHKRCE